MEQTMASVALPTKGLENGGNSNRDRSEQTASLLDTLLATFDSIRHRSHDHDGAKRNALRLPVGCFPKFSLLPPELRESIFQFAFEQYVVKMYCEGWHQVKSAIESSRSQTTKQNPERNTLTFALMNTEAPSRVIFVEYRPARTVALLHVCRESRKLAVNRYGLPNPSTLLFDPDIDCIRHCGQWPYQSMPKFWHVFGIDDKHIYRFEQVESSQMHAAGFSTGIDLRLSPDQLFNSRGVDHFFPMCTALRTGANVASVTPREAIFNAVSDLVHTLSWIEVHMPRLAKLCFTVALEHSDGSLPPNQLNPFDDERDTITVDLSNIRSCIVTVEEWMTRNKGRACLPYLSCLSICSVSEETMAPIGKTTKFSIDPAYSVA